MVGSTGIAVYGVAFAGVDGSVGCGVAHGFTHRGGIAHYPGETMESSGDCGQGWLAVVGEVRCFIWVCWVFRREDPTGFVCGFLRDCSVDFDDGAAGNPVFHRTRCGLPFTAQNHSWIDRASLILFLLFMLADFALAMASGHRGATWAAALLALVQVPLHIMRLWGWYHPNIWQKPLLWVCIWRMAG